MKHVFNLAQYGQLSLLPPVHLPEEKQEVLSVHVPGPRVPVVDGTVCLVWCRHGFSVWFDSTLTRNKVFVDRTGLN